MTRSRMLRPPIRCIGLSPPPIRRPRPPASRTPGTGSIVTIFALAFVPRRFLFHKDEILVEHDACLAGQRDEPLAPCAPDQRQPDLSRQLNAPRRETGT